MDTELPRNADFPPGMGPPNGKLPTTFTTGREVEKFLSSEQKRKDPPLGGRIDRFVTKKVKESHSVKESVPSIPKMGLGASGKRFFESMM